MNLFIGQVSKNRKRGNKRSFHWLKAHNFRSLLSSIWSRTERIFIDRGDGVSKNSLVSSKIVSSSSSSEDADEFESIPINESIETQSKLEKSRVASESRGRTRTYSDLNKRSESMAEDNS